MPAPTGSPVLSFKHHALLSIAALLVMGGAVVTPFISHPIAQAFALATEHKPETFTELYFVTSPQHPLPQNAPKGTPQGFTFHVTSHQASDHWYHYTATMQIAHQTTTLQTGDIELQPGASREVTVPFTMAAADTTALITVSLNNPAEHISFRSQS